MSRITYMGDGGEDLQEYQKGIGVIEEG